MIFLTRVLAQNIHNNVIMCMEWNLYTHFRTSIHTIPSPAYTTELYLIMIGSACIMFRLAGVSKEDDTVCIDYP